MNELEQKLGDVFGKLPALPEGICSFLVKIAPWLAVVSVVFSIPLILGVLGLGAVLGGLGAYGIYGTSNSMLSLVLIIVSVVLTALAIPGLFARTYNGWKFTFWTVLVNGVESIVAYNVIGLVLGLGIGFYILFQVRRYYQ